MNALFPGTSSLGRNKMEVQMSRHISALQRSCFRNISYNVTVKPIQFSIPIIHNIASESFFLRMCVLSHGMTMNWTIVATSKVHSWKNTRRLTEKKRKQIVRMPYQTICHICIVVFVCRFLIHHQSDGT